MILWLSHSWLVSRDCYCSLFLSINTAHRGGAQAQKCSSAHLCKVTTFSDELTWTSACISTEGTHVELCVYMSKLAIITSFPRKHTTFTNFQTLIPLGQQSWLKSKHYLNVFCRSAFIVHRHIISKLRHWNHLLGNSEEPSSPVWSQAANN